MSSKKLLYGVGINDAGYAVTVRLELPRVEGKRHRKVVWACPFYQKWKSLLERCYSDTFKKKWTTYAQCTLHEDWLYFSKFRSWMIEQNWEGNELDKDILVQGNKHYSPSTCVFVSKEVNYLLLDKGNSRGEFPLGVYFNKRDKCFYATVTCGGKPVHLGTTRSVEVAHRWWQEAKLSRIKSVAEKQVDMRIRDALLLRVDQLAEDIKHNRITVKL